MPERGSTAAESALVGGASAPAAPMPEWQRGLRHARDLRLTHDAVNVLLLLCNLPEWAGVFARDVTGVDCVARALPAVVGLPAPAVGAACDRVVAVYVRAWMQVQKGVTFARRDCADAIAAAASSNPARETPPRDEWDALADALAALPGGTGDGRGANGKGPPRR